MKFTRKASANWKGSGKEGKGTVSTETKVLDNSPYSFKTRFEGGAQTNPEELIGAAHAGCFTMKLSFALAEKGFTASNIDTSSSITMEDGKITQAHLDLKASVPDISEEDFQAAANEAKTECPISVLLNTKITLDAELI